MVEEENDEGVVNEDFDECETESSRKETDDEVDSEQFDPNELENGEEQEEFDPNEPEGNIEQEEFEPNELNEEEEPEQFDPNESEENNEENEFDPNEIGGDDESDYDPYGYEGNFEQEGNSPGFYENFNAESMNTVLLSENLIYAYLSEYMELMAEKEAETEVSEEQADVDNSKEEISELKQFLNEERERIRLEQQHADLDEINEPESEFVAEEEDLEQEQEVEVGNQEKVSEEMVPSNEEEIENQEMKLEEELQSALPNESIESGKVEEIEEKNKELQPHGIEEKIEEQEKELKADDEKNEKYEEHQSKNQIEEEHDIKTELIALENELELSKEEHEEREEHEESTKEGELSQISQELEVIHEINSSETEVLTYGQEEQLEQIEEYKDPHQELEEILEQTRKFEQEALIEVEQEQEKSDKNIEENYEKTKKLYNQETGRRAIYANNETEGFKQWLEQKKESEEKQEHLRIEKENAEVLNKEIEQESDEGINPKLRLLLKEIIENYNFLENLTTRFKELYESAQNKQISKAEKNELNLLINSLKKVGPTKFMLFASIKAIKRYTIKEGFSDKANLNHTLTNFFTKFMQNNLVFKNLKELISPIEAELFERFMHFTHETELIKNIVNEFNKRGNWIKNLRHTQTFINFLKKRLLLFKNKFQAEILAKYLSLIIELKEADSISKAIKNLLMTNKGKFNAFNLEKWLLISYESARNQLKKIFTEDEYQKYVRTQEHVSIKTIQIIANKKGGKCHTKEIKNAKSKVDLECAEGHKFSTTYNSVVYADTWCPECHIYLGEEICRQFFERIFKRPFPKSKPPWLHGLELDGLCNALKITWEYQGRHHYEKAFGRTDEELKKIQTVDAYKAKKSEDQGNLHLQIPGVKFLPYDKMQNYIVKLYEKLSGKSLGKIPKYNWREFKIHENEHAKKFRTYIEEKGGTLLTPYFSAKKEVTILCEKGHQWTTSPNSIYMKNWCPECAGNKKGTTEEYQKIGEKFQCELLNTYINAKTLLQYKCPKGHKFKKNPYWLKKKFEEIEILCPECKTYLYAKKFQKFVRNKRGQIVTPYKGRFKPIKIKCEHEHEWETTPGSTYQGHWCKTCKEENNPNKNRQEAAKQEFLKIIKARNYALISKYKNTSKQVRVKCQRNHTFTITPNYFKKLVKLKKEPCRDCRKN